MKRYKMALCVTSALVAGVSIANSVSDDVVTEEPPVEFCVKYPMFCQSDTMGNGGGKQPPPPPPTEEEN